MKKWIAFLGILIMSVVMLAACGGETDTENQGTGKVNSSVTDKGNQSSSSSTTTSNLGDYNVVIDSCRLATDYEDDPVVIVKYVFTNNSEEAQSFMWALDANVYQNDIGLNECYFVDNSANYSSDNQTKEIKSGAKLTVEVAYELNDSTTDIEVEVSELISLSNKKVTKTFSIK